MKSKIIFYKIFILIYLLFSKNVSVANDEISLGIALGKGIMENVSGLHTPVTGNPGNNVKGLVLDDDSLNTNISLNIDYNKNLKDNLYLNSGVSLAKIASFSFNFPSIISIGNSLFESLFFNLILAVFSWPT